MQASPLKAKFEACGVTNLHAEHTAECIVNDHLDCIDSGECPDPCCDPECEDVDPIDSAREEISEEENPKHKGKHKGKPHAKPEAKARAAEGTRRSLRDLVNEARAKGVPWVTILSLLLKGLQFLIEFLKQQPEPA